MSIATLKPLDKGKSKTKNYTKRQESVPNWENQYKKDLEDQAYNFNLKLSHQKEMTQKVALMCLARINYLLKFNPNNRELLDLRKSLNASYDCKNVLQEKDGRQHSWRCKKKNCIHCSHARTCKTRSSYMENIMKLPDLQFITLTSKTCSRAQLRKKIEQGQLTFRRITKQLSKKKIKLQYLRSIEIIKAVNNKFHVHYHIIISGEDKAKLLAKLWFKTFTSHYGNKQVILKTQLLSLQEVDKSNPKKAIAELVKYITKIGKVYGDKLVHYNRNNERVETSVDDFIEILIATKGLRQIQAVGIEKVKDQKEHKSTIWTSKARMMIHHSQSKIKIDNHQGYQSPDSTEILCKYNESCLTKNGELKETLYRGGKLLFERIDYYEKQLSKHPKNRKYERMQSLRKHRIYNHKKRISIKSSISNRSKA